MQRHMLPALNRMLQHVPMRLEWRMSSVNVCLRFMFLFCCFVCIFSFILTSNKWDTTGAKLSDNFILHFIFFVSSDIYLIFSCRALGAFPWCTQCIRRPEALLPTVLDLCREQRKSAIMDRLCRQCNGTDNLFIILLSIGSLLVFTFHYI